YKGFLRLRIGDDGDLTIHPVKLETISRAWRPNPDGAPDEPWLVPTVALRPELIEEPIVVTRVSTPRVDQVNP
ncbi:MAG: hypothetical protein M3443_16345, partial [Actinomycetota bacterium]|nr:hypothetical protein [Actinomycetota bacterium]